MTVHDRQTYQMRVVGHLDDRWSTWFEEFAIAPCDDGTCTLTGTVSDQAQLHGILARLRDIGETLLSLRTLDAQETCGSRPCQQSQLDPATDSSAAAVHAELGVDVLGVRAQRVERHEEPLRDVGTVELGG